MEAFYKITILVMIVFLILILTVIGILMGKKSNNLVYPPVASQCPDYWTFDGSYCIVPNQVMITSDDGSSFEDDPNANVLNGFSSVKNIPQDTPGIFIEPDETTQKINIKIDFSDPGWSGTCSKKQWANTNNIVWDGVSNYNTCAGST